MNKNKKITIRKIIYGILFLICIGGFIYIGNKYTDDQGPTEITIQTYYPNINVDFTIIGGSSLIDKIKSGKAIILIGSSQSKWSQKYVEQIAEIKKIYHLDNIYYYDLASDKSQKNSLYYDVKEKLNGSLVSTDGSDNNLQAPSLYIINNGEVKYYNIATVAMKNTDTPEEYWTISKKNEFEKEIINAINKYYLNN